MIEKKIKIIRKIYKSDNTNYYVYKAQTLKEIKKDVIITGILEEFSKGEILQIKGESFNHPKFGDQLKILEYSIDKPLDNLGVIKYLSSPRFKGIGVKTAQKIVDKFKENSIKIIENSPEKLGKIGGISKKIIKELKKTRKDNQILKKLQIHLLPFGLGINTILNIYNRFKEHSYTIVQSNPYLLIDEVSQIAFKTADLIAKSQGVDRESTFRIQAGLESAVNQLIQQNKTLGFTPDELVLKAKELLLLDEKIIAPQLANMIKKNQLKEIEDNNHKIVFKYQHFLMENESARKLQDILAHSDPTIENLNISVPTDYYRSFDLELSKEQKKAIQTTLNNKITIISGGPGTGKTTLIKILLDIFKKFDKSVKISAPTGRAAKRIFEASGFSAQTIHRMLKFQPQTNTFYFNQNNKLTIDVLIIDEFSMVDSFLFYSLLKALPDSVKLILIGDKDQLPSVGPGNVLFDLIKSKLFTSIFLKRNFRQRENGQIIENAYRIKNQQNLLIKPFSDNLDFVYISIQNDDHAIKKILRIFDYYKEDYKFNSFKLQILSPTYKGISGIDNINFQIQNIYNPAPLLYHKNDLIFKKRDKVMQIKNNYDKGVFNGELGIIVDLNHSKDGLLIEFDTCLVEYQFSELDQLTLAYAVSVHKAQGSEFELVVLLMLPHHFMFLNKEIFYTAVTRAKKKLLLLSTQDTILRCVNTSTPVKRKTSLLYNLFNIHDNHKRPK